MPGPAFIRKFFGNLFSNASAYALGAATADTLRPELQDLVNLTWSLHPHVPPPALLLAEGVASGQVDEAQARRWAAQQGFDDAQFTALRNIADVGPGASYAFELFRRNIITEAGFRRALKRQSIEAEWIDDLVKLKDERLGVEVVSAAIQRGIMQAPFPLPVEPPTSGGKVPAFPTSNIDAVAEAAASGYDVDRLFVETALRGNPMGPHEAAQAAFRGIIDQVDYERAIAEGNTRNEWRDAIFEQARQIPSVTNYIDAHVRGWIDEAAMLAGAARHGMTREDTELEFLVHGRPLSWHQVWIGLKRGGRYDGPLTDEKEIFYKSLRESSLRPEWYDLAWAQRFTLPATFALRTMAQSGDLSQAEVHQILIQQGWEPGLADTISQRWSTPAAAKADPWVTKAEVQLWTAAHKAFVGGALDEAEATTALNAVGVPVGTEPAVLRLWSFEAAIQKSTGPGTVTFPA